MTKEAQRHRANRPMFVTSPAYPLASDAAREHGVATNGRAADGQRYEYAAHRKN
jgi:hypothetical protein